MARARNQKLTVSVISLYELRRLALKGVIEQKRTEKLLTWLRPLLPDIVAALQLGETLLEVT